MLNVYGLKSIVFKSAKCETHFDPKCTCVKMARPRPNRQVWLFWGPIIGSRSAVRGSPLATNQPQPQRPPPSCLFLCVCVSPSGNFVVVVQGGVCYFIGPGPSFNTITDRRSGSELATCLDCTEINQDLFRGLLVDAFFFLGGAV